MLLVMLPLFAGAQIITLVAGNNIQGYSGDFGPATAAEFYDPAGVALDKAGNIYIADQDNQCIRRVDAASGIITTVAGRCSGGVASGGYIGDGGSALLARLFAPTSVAFDPAGNMYIATSFRIVKVDNSGIIRSIAGTGTAGYGGDSGPATAAILNTPWFVVTDIAGNVYFSDASNNSIRKISTSGIITSIAGCGDTAGFRGDGGPATAALLNNPVGVAIDCKGNFYFSDRFNGRIRKIDAAGIITTIGGNGTNGFSGDGGPATAAQINITFGIAVDQDGSVFLADANNNRVRKISSSGIISTVAGIGPCASSGVGGPATAACLNYPMGITVDSSFNVYLSDAFAPRILKIAGAGYGGPGMITGAGTVCADSTITLADAPGGGAWSTSNTTASVVGGVVRGIAGGIDTIRYTMPDYCLLSAAKTITVDTCAATVVPNSVGNLNTGRVEGVKITPNPSSNLVTVTASKNISSIAIVNFLGQVLYTHEYNGAAEVQLYTADLPPGIYLVKVNGSETGKFVKQ